MYDQQIRCDLVLAQSCCALLRLCVVVCVVVASDVSVGVDVDDGVAVVIIC